VVVQMNRRQMAFLFVRDPDSPVPRPACGPDCDLTHLPNLR